MYTKKVNIKQARVYLRCAQGEVGLHLSVSLQSSSLVFLVFVVPGCVEAFWVLCVLSSVRFLEGSGSSTYFLSVMCAGGMNIKQSSLVSLMCAGELNMKQSSVVSVMYAGRGGSGESVWECNAQKISIN